MSELEAAIAQRYQEVAPEDHLGTIKGLGAVTAPAILAAVGTPHRFKSQAAFRGGTGVVPIRRHLAALSGLFRQVLELAQQAGLVTLGHVALDGTKIRANASKHKVMSYDYPCKEEPRLAAEVAEMLRRAEEADAADDAEYGSDRRGDELPEELRQRESRLRKIREAKAALEAQAREKVERQRAEHAAQAAQAAERGTPRGRTPKPPRDTPEDRVQYNFTDPESHIMQNADGAFVQAYNAQAAVDAAHQIIVAAAVTAQPADAPHLEPMATAIAENTGTPPKRLSADAGYFSAHAVAVAASTTDLYIATEKVKHSQPVPPAPRGRIPKHLSVKERMQRKLRTQAGRAVYKMRKAIVEPVFGQIKGARGFVRFLLRGQAKVCGEWALVTTAHNLCRLFAARPRVEAVLHTATG